MMIPREIYLNLKNQIASKTKEKKIDGKGKADLRIYWDSTDQKKWETE